MKLKKIEEIVFEILKTIPKSRSDDFRLYAGVLKRTGVNVEMKLIDFLLNAKDNKYPAFDSVSRARRKIFENYPELQPLETKLNREKKEREYLDYSRE